MVTTAAPTAAPVSRPIPAVLRSHSGATAAESRANADRLLSTLAPDDPRRRAAAKLARRVRDSADAIDQARDLAALYEAMREVHRRTLELAAVTVEDHPDPLARVLSVAGRIAASDADLGDEAAGRCRDWLSRLATA